MSISYQSRTDLERMISKNEQILWRGKPDKKCFILEGIFNPLLPLAILWLAVDSLFIFIGIKAITKGDPMGFGILAFILIHLMPVWIYLLGALLTVRRYRHTEYIVTDKGVYISGGVFSYSCEMKPFTELARVNIHRGIIDQYIGVGDVVLTGNNVADMYSRSQVRINTSLAGIGITIADIREYHKVFDLIKKLQEDIYTDTMYPNDLRPPENHGYKTEYKGSNNLDI